MHIRHVYFVTEGLDMENKLATPEDFLRIENRNMQQTIDQLRANAKGHKKTVDKLSTKVSKLTQELTEANQHISKLEIHPANSVGPEKKTKWSTICYAAIGIVLCGFLFALGAFGAWGWLLMLKDLL